jgi:hypothetical protein
MKKLILLILSSLLCTTPVNANHFGLGYSGGVINKVKVKLNGASRTWSDGTFAKNCSEYLSPGKGKAYIGDVGTGFYKIDPGVPGEAPFDAYCDMVNNGGGWMLLFAGNQTPNYTNTPNAMYTGDSTENYTFTILGNVNVTQAPLQAAVRTVPFTYLRYDNFLLISSSSTTTFKQKFNQRIGWSTGSSFGLSQCLDGIAGWDRANSGTNTYTQAVLGCVNGYPYGDVTYAGMGVYEEARATSCFVQNSSMLPCYNRYLVGEANHRGTVVFYTTDLNSDIHEQVWIK